MLNFSLKSTIESRLTRYALAGGALLGLPAAADAGIVYSGLQNLSIDTVTPLQLDFNLDTITDVTFAGSAAFPSSDITATPGASNALNLGPLAFGAPITMVNTTDTVGGQLVSSKFNCCPTTNYYGPWAAQGATPAYIGVRFTSGGLDYLGWAQLSLSVPNGTLIDWAYENTPETTIAAGDVGGAAVPEPSSLALFAMGAAGILALRRRRNAS
jgi:hypothetical protein